MLTEIDWGLYLLAAMALTIAPGPDNLLVLALGLTQGRRAALGAAWGMASGNIVHTLLVAGGVAALLAASPAALTVLKLTGAGYLGWLAAQSWRAPPPTLGAAPERSTWGWYRRGVVMNLLNPKVVLFFLAFIPPFLPVGTPDPALATIALGAVFIAQVVVIFSGIALLAGALGRWWQGHPQAQRWAPRATAGMLATLALLLVVDALR